LVKLRPSFHAIKDHQRLKGLSHGFKTVPYVSKGFFAAVWDPIWADLRETGIRKLKWE